MINLNRVRNSFFFSPSFFFLVLSPFTFSQPINRNVYAELSGTYKGSLPCADCREVITAIDLRYNGTYRITLIYGGKSDSIFEQSGSFSFDTLNHLVVLSGILHGPNRYKVDPGMITQLDMNGKIIAGSMAENYILRRLDPQITEIRWLLTELMGKPVNDTARMGRAIFLLCSSIENRVHGFSGCNDFSGVFALLPGNRVAFSKMITTLKACPDMTIESELLNVLRMADNYTIKEHRLQLNKAKMAPLAIFESRDE